MPTYQPDPWSEKSDWTPPISDEESRVRPFTAPQTIPVPPAPAQNTVIPQTTGFNKPGRTTYTGHYTPTTYGGSPPGNAGGQDVSSYGSGMDTWRYGSPGDIRKQKYAQSGGRGGGGGAAPSEQEATRTTKRTTFTQPRPQAPETPELKLPQVNKRAIAALQQKHAAPGVRKLRESLQMALSQGSDNPNVRRMTIREALQGYGTGLEGVMAGAYGTARSEHQADIQQQSQEAQLNWQAEVARSNAMYQAAMNEYMASAVQTSETGPASTVAMPATPVSSPRQPTYLRTAYSSLSPYIRR